MINIDPYNTTYGQMINKEKVIKEIISYLSIKGNRNLNYEFINKGNVKYIYVLGVDEEERSFPIWDQPMLFKHGNDTIIATDLRKYVQKIKAQPLNLYDVVKDHSAVEYLTNAATIMGDFTNGEIGNYKKLFNGTAVAYAALTGHVINTMVSLNPLERVNVEIAASFVAHAQLLDIGNNESISMYTESILNRIISTRLSMPVSASMVKSIEYPHSLENGIASYVEFYKSVLPEEKAGMITDRVFINLLGNLWYGPGGNETLIMSMECMPLFMSLTYTLLSDNSFKKQRLAMIMNYFERNIDKPGYLKYMSMLLKGKATMLSYVDYDLESVLEN